RRIVVSSPRRIGGVRMKRRQFLGVLGGAMATWPLVARAQRPRDRPLIAYLAGGTHWNASRLMGFFQEGLRELGYVEGRNIDLVYRFAEGRVGRLPALAEELVRFCQVVEGEMLIRQAGASPQSYPPFRRPAPCLSRRPNSRIAAASLDDSRPLTTDAVAVESAG